MKRIPVIALILLIVFSMSVSVFAEEATLNQDNTQTTLTFTQNMKAEPKEFTVVS